MKKIILMLLVLAGATSISISQTFFQKITNQPLVNDNSFGSGCAWGDYDNDGKLDLIVTSYNDFGNSSYPILYKNMGNDNFQVVSNNGITNNALYQTLACAWGDFNHDGRLDLFLATGMNQVDLLYKGMGGGNFSRITAGSIVNTAEISNGINWTDYDKDGFLDILVVQNGYNLLFKGNPDGTFTQITTGPIVTDYGNHRRAVWGDYDNDHYPDLFVCNYDGQVNNLYHNNRNGTFTKVTAGDIVNTPSYGSGCAWGDYNNDGWLDLYVTNGGGGPNFLYKNNHNGTFTRITTGPEVTDAGAGFGCCWGDFDNDGDLDLFVANNYHQKNCLYRNDGNDNFTRMDNEIVNNELSSSVGCAWGDYNNDGKLDLFVVNQGYNAPVESDYLYKNVGAAPCYLIVRMSGGGIGTRITLRIGNYIAIREVSGGSGCSSQDMLWQHFGLGFLADYPNPTIDSVIVDWNDGLREVQTNVPANQEIDFHGTVGIHNQSNQVPTQYALYQNYPNPFNPTTVIEYSIIKNSPVKITVYDMTGRVVSVPVNKVQSAGNYQVNFDAGSIASGVYFYKIETNEFTDTKKMMLVK